MADTKNFRIQHLRNEDSTVPTNDDLTYGEIAIGYKKGAEAIFIKNGADEIVEFNPVTTTGSIRFIDDEDNVVATMPLIANTQKGSYGRTIDENNYEPIGEWSDI